MKHIYTLLTLAFLSSVSTVDAQTVIFSDNFDSYAPGAGIVASNPAWSYWNAATPSDALVDSSQSFSGDNSCRVNGTSVDLILPIGPYTSGIYYVDFKMLLPQGSTGGYFNLLHVWNANSTNYEWAVDVFFDADGSCYITSGGTQNPTNFVAPLGEWFDIQVQVFLDDDLGVIKANGNEVLSFPWSINNADGTPGTLQLAALNFYGTAFTQNSQGLYHIDDVSLTEMPPPLAIESESEKTISLFPNPAQNFFVIGGLTSSNCLMTLSDLSGKTINREVVNSGNNLVAVSELKSGVYFVTLEMKNSRIVKKLVVN
ncbi:MAG: T9SS type A sorting domain-containing protein [Bacteroidia bacterium]